jgi:UDP-4-amino-4-deoxy-L-arabinose-oxoglutarate aminotransferase
LIVNSKLRRVPFYRHDLGEAELNSVKECLAQPILTTGEYVEQVEQSLAAYLGVKHALCVTSCTGGMHMSLLGLGIGPGDEVITTPMTFIATATSILEAGAKPVFADVDPETGNIDPDKVEAAMTDKTKAILPVHLFGLMCDMRGIREVAERHGLAIVEDAAHCVEGRRDGVRPGALSDTACFSFYATKNLTCGEGGAVVTNDSELYEKLKLLRVHGMTKTAYDRHREGYKHWDMTLLGWKYNMSNIEAAILLPQFARLDRKLAERQMLATHYEEQLRNLAGIRLLNLSASEDCIHAHHVFAVMILGNRRDAVIAELQRRGIEVVVNYRPVHLMSYFRMTGPHYEGQFPTAETLGEQAVSLPFYPGMSADDVDYVVTQLREILLFGQ